MKYEEIACVLATEYAMEVHNLLLDQPEDDLYKKLKDQLTLQIADSERQKIQQLLTAEELRKCKSTQLLCKMQQLLGGKAPFDSSLLPVLFLQGLPSIVQMILASADEISINKLAEMADRIMHVATPIVTIISTSTGDDGIRRLIRAEVNMIL